MTSHRDVSPRELVLAVIGACLAAVVMHWPLVLNLGGDIPKDLGDPLAQAWQVAWGGQALAEQPFDFFQSNQFWPLDDTLAFSDALLGYAPAGLVGSGPEAAVTRYDLLFLFAYALAFFGAYLLARELGLGPAGATVAGAAFAFAPFRLEQDGHLHVISSGGIPLCLALGVRGYRLRSPGWMLAAWVVATWQLTLGFTLGVPLAYLLAALAVVCAVVWLHRHRPALDRRLLAATLAGAALFVAAGALISSPYLRVADEHPQATRSPAVIEAYSGQPYAFLAAPEENLVWGEATAGLRDELQNVPEQTLFPGLLIIGLAAVGVASAGLDRRLRLGLAGVAVGVSVLALGLREEGGLLWPYRVVYETLPGWEAIRTPGRLVTFASLALALLAAAGAEAAVRAANRRGVRPAFAGLIAAIIALAVIVEGRGLPFDPTDRQAQPRAPVPPAETADLPEPQLHLPAHRAEDNRRYLLWSTDGFPLIVNGRSSVQPVLTETLIAGMRRFPDRASVSRLQGLGVRTVILHTARTPGSPQRRAARRPVAGLPLTRSRRPGLVVYEIGSASAASRPREALGLG